MAPARTAYFFGGGKYARYDIGAAGVDTVDPGIYPRDIAEGWTAMPSDFIPRFDAAVPWPDGFVYFFKGPLYVRWDATNDTVHPPNIYPRETREGWPAFPPEFAAEIDAAINWGDGFAYFFKGPKYIAYDIAHDTVDLNIYPRDVSEGWTAFPAEFQQGVNAAVNWGNGTAYFFKNIFTGAGFHETRYITYDMTHDTVSAEFPLPVTQPGRWPALVGAGYTGPFNDVVEWPQVDVANFKVEFDGGCRTQSDAQRVVAARIFRMHALMGETHPSTAACGEYRQFVRGQFLLDERQINYITQGGDGVPPVVMQPRPAPGAADDGFREDGIPASRSRFRVDQHYGHRTAPYGNSDILDIYVPPPRRTGGQYEGKDAPSIVAGGGAFVKVDLDFRGQVIDSCNGAVVVRSTEWTVTCQVPA